VLTFTEETRNACHVGLFLAYPDLHSGRDQDLHFFLEEINGRGRSRGRGRGRGRAGVEDLCAPLKKILGRKILKIFLEGRKTKKFENP
jgi:hypothetical protein